MGDPAGAGPRTNGRRIPIADSRRGTAAVDPTDEPGLVSTTLKHALRPRSPDQTKP